MGCELQLTARFSISATEFFVIMSQGLMQVRIHSDKRYWEPKSRRPNSKKGEREREKNGVIRKKKKRQKWKKEERKEKKEASKNAAETIDAQINFKKTKKMYINIIKGRKKIQKQNCIHLF